MCRVYNWVKEIGRSTGLFPDARKNKLLTGVDPKTMVGLEIGPLHNPIISRDEGTIYYVDYADMEFLRQKYENEPNVDCSKIPNIDFIWGKEPLSVLIPPNLQFDYIIASHVIEHVPDVIGWLNELEATLKTGAKLCLAVPDKRYTFDCLRQLTGISELIEAHLNRSKRPTVRQIFDFCYHAVELDPSEAWANGMNGIEKIVGPKMHKHQEGLIDLCLNVKNDEDIYIDTHCSVFTFESFLDLLKNLFALDLINYKITNFFPPKKNSNEFIIIMEKLPEHLSQEEKRIIQMKSLQ